MELVRLACQMPDQVGRSLSLWDCAELARQLEREGQVESISPQTVQRLLEHHRLKPWRSHVWLGKKAPRDEEFIARTKNICDLYTRTLSPHEVVLCVDEKTSIQPRPRLDATRPAQPDRPVQVEHEYERAGAVNLFAAFDTRTGKVYGKSYARKRMVEFIDFLEFLNRTISSGVTLIHIICDNVSTHHGSKVRAWLAKHPRFKFHFTPVHCSWMNQVEQWFSILQRKRLTIPNFSNLEELKAKIDLFVEQWNAVAEPFKWTPRSFDKVLAKAEADVAAAKAVA
jgi:transposase